MQARFFFLLTIIFFALWGLFNLYPALDLKMSSVYFKNGIWTGTTEPYAFLREVYYDASRLLAVYAVLMSIYSYFRPTLVPPYFYRFFAVMAVFGNVLLVNEGFKEFFGRARPYVSDAFGGDKLFTPPPFTPVDQCAHNCSFVSGEASGAMILILMGVALFGENARGKLLVWLLIFPMAWMRIMAGKHFLSDVIMSMVLMSMLYWLQLWITHKTPRDLWGSWRGFGADFIGIFRRKRGNQDAA